MLKYILQVLTFMSSDIGGVWVANDQNTDRCVCEHRLLDSFEWQRQFLHRHALSCGRQES